MLEYVFIVCVKDYSTCRVVLGVCVLRYYDWKHTGCQNRLMTSHSVSESGVFVVNSHSGSGSAMVYATADYSLKD